MQPEYEYCTLEGNLPDPIDADTSFDFSANHSCEYFLTQALEALKQAQNHENWDKYSLKTYYATDLNLEDGLIVLQAAIAEY
ncbi:MAG: hypothetical protein KME38_29390 [Spirirestis rafaelensis WJT71-NPBG6]|jgi:hypothetical protein|nr:hypothetical protein [Spirirestis rafaelensis WJT71-NPBG6]